MRHERNYDFIIVKTLKAIFYHEIIITRIHIATICLNKNISTFVKTWYKKKIVENRYIWARKIKSLIIFFIRNDLLQQTFVFGYQLVHLINLGEREGAYR